MAPGTERLGDCAVERVRRLYGMGGRNLKAKRPRRHIVAVRPAGLPAKFRVNKGPGSIIRVARELGRAGKHPHGAPPSPSIASSATLYSNTVRFGSLGGARGKVEAWRTDFNVSRPRASHGVDAGWGGCLIDRGWPGPRTCRVSYSRQGKIRDSVTSRCGLRSGCEQSRECVNAGKTRCLFWGTGHRPFDLRTCNT